MTEGECLIGTCLSGFVIGRDGLVLTVLIRSLDETIGDVIFGTIMEYGLTDGEQLVGIGFVVPSCDRTIIATVVSLAIPGGECIYVYKTGLNWRKLKTSHKLLRPLTLMQKER